MLTYRAYITDSLYGLGQGKAMSKRWIEMLDERDKKPDTRTGDEIALYVIENAGLKFKGKEDGTDDTI